MSLNSWSCLGDLCRSLCTLSRLCCWRYPARRIANSSFNVNINIRSRSGISSAESTPAVLPEQRKSNDLRATMKEAQYRHPANNHPPPFTSLPPHNTAKMLLGMKKFPVKVRK